jgi:hypothetical protein
MAIVFDFLKAASAGKFIVDRNSLRSYIPDWWLNGRGKD